MKMVCAWCKKELGPEHDPIGDGKVSHGICPDCKVKQWAQFNAAMSMCKKHQASTLETKDD